MSDFQRDCEKEQIVHTFLMKYFYGPMKEKGVFTSVETIEDIEKQYQGIDVELKFANDDRIYNIDEKAAVKYIYDPLNDPEEKPLRTFAIEIKYVDEKGEERQGWFVKEVKTDFYYFMWLKGNKKLKDVDDIKEVELYSVPCKNLRSVLSEDTSKEAVEEYYEHLTKPSEYKICNMFTDVCYEKDNEERKSRITMKIADIPTKPLLYLLKKDLLLDLSDKAYKITHDNIENIK